MGLENGDVMNEYKETLERDEFLAKEVADLAAGAVSLRQIIAELEEKIGEEFKIGIDKINEHLREFFTLMFGGGSAELYLAKDKKERPPEAEEDEVVDLVKDLSRDAEPKAEGIELKVSLPRKKIQGLQMLSGGERALTSIALLFAMSQVNPPPFLILDETDAALDEANARKYSEMVGNLARHSQLILITHNRETMSRAGIIYGVTMGRDGVSRLLSIKFDEAVGFAK
jgi:chromosome segregation protein